MGIAKAGAKLLLLEASRLPFSGSVITLGRQHVYVTADELGTMARERGVTLKPVREELHQVKELATKGYISDECFFRMLGFDNVVCMDFSDYEACHVIFDLNAAETPTELKGAFDLVLDFGTIEHIFDIAAAISHCVRMVKPGGRIIHTTPSSNCIEHGFHSVSPTFFADFYSASRFQLNRIYLCGCPLDLPRGTWTVYDYLGGNRQFIPLGQLDGKIWCTFSVVTSTAESTVTIPQQSQYLDVVWQRAPGADKNSSQGDEPSHTRAGRLLERLKRFPRLMLLAKSLIRKWRSFINWKRTRSKWLPYPFVGRF